MKGETRVLPGDATLSFSSVFTGEWRLIPDSLIGLFARLSDVGGTATVEFHHTNDPTLPPSAATLLATATLSGISDFAMQAKLDAAGIWKCAKVTAIGGGAVVTALLSV